MKRAALRNTTRRPPAETPAADAAEIKIITWPSIRGVTP